MSTSFGIGTFVVIEIISSVERGAIYFSISTRHFFPEDSIAKDRKGINNGGIKGTDVLFVATVGSDKYEYKTDIKTSSGLKISPRKSFARYFKAIGAKIGDKFKITRISLREYEITPVIH